MLLALLATDVHAGRCRLCLAIPAHGTASPAVGVAALAWLPGLFTDKQAPVCPTQEGKYLILIWAYALEPTSAGTSEPAVPGADVQLNDDVRVAWKDESGCKRLSAVVFVSLIVHMQVHR